jgi:hypothetical protein
MESLKLIHKYILIGIFLFSSSGLFAQSDYSYISEGLRSYSVNPASVGTYNKMAISNRMNFTPFQFSDSPSNFQLNGAFKCLKIEREDKATVRGAIGFKGDYGRSYFLFRTGLSAQLNLQFDLGNSFLSVGLAPRFEKMAYPDYSFGCLSSEIVFPIFPPSDYNYQTNVMLDAGVYWFNKHFNLGVSTSNLIRNSPSTEYYKLNRAYHFHGAYQLLLNRKLRLKGLFNTQITGGGTNISAMLYAILWRNELSFGVGFQNGENLLGGTSIQLKAFNLGCFMRYHLSDLNQIRYSLEYRVAYQLFDKQFDLIKTVGGIAF